MIPDDLFERGMQSTDSKLQREADFSEVGCQCRVSFFVPKMSLGLVLGASQVKAWLQCSLSRRTTPQCLSEQCRGASLPATGR